MATLHGRYEPTQVGELLRDIDVLVVPSRWPEIGPFVILEAFAAKTPVIAARMGNMPELVDHNVNGLLFEPDSASDLQAHMRRFLEEPDLYERLRAGIPAVRTQDQEVAEIFDIYAQIAGGRSDSKRVR
jgi:glycosyltransferase involved in cell wall biosynthesis